MVRHRIKTQVQFTTRPRTSALAAVVFVLCSVSAHGEPIEWSRPSIDQWFYPANASPGIRVLGPTFGSLGGPGTGTDPARRGATLVGFDTSLQVEPGFPPIRYDVESVLVTLTMAPGNGNIVYDMTYDSIDELSGGADDPGRPIELYGVGFRNDYENPYERLGFGAVDYLPPEFEEGTSLFASDTGAYDLFPLGDDGTGQLTDVYNSPTGGYNALIDEPVEVWDTLPWAIGTVDGLRVGESVSYDSTFVFEVDLSQPNVLGHIQRSLSEGGVGFFVSSLHQPDGHDGTVVYPQWYMKEHPRGTAATLTLDVTVHDGGIAGDFDQDGTLGVSDIDLLMSVVADQAHDVSFDLNADLQVNDLDRDTWLANAGAVNGLGGPYLIGDSNLDRSVDVNDLNALAVSWQTEEKRWTQGNFSGGGVTPVDLNAMAVNWQRTVSAVTVGVPEPRCWVLAIAGTYVYSLTRRRHLARTV